MSKLEISAIRFGNIAVIICLVLFLLRVAMDVFERLQRFSRSFIAVRFGGPSKPAILSLRLQVL
jgi:hypothetical protein